MGDTCPMDLKGRTSVRVTGGRENKEGLIAKGSPTRLRVGALLTDKTFKIMESGNGNETTAHGFSKARRIKGGSHPGNSLRNNQLGIVEESRRAGDKGVAG